MTDIQRFLHMSNQTVETMKHTKKCFYEFFFYSLKKVPNCDCVTSVKCWNVTIVCTVISHWHQRRFHFNFFCRPHSVGCSVCRNVFVLRDPMFSWGLTTAFLTMTMSRVGAVLGALCTMYVRVCMCSRLQLSHAETNSVEKWRERTKERVPTTHDGKWGEMACERTVSSRRCSFFGAVIRRSALLSVVMMRSRAFNSKRIELTFGPMRITLSQRDWCVYTVYAKSFWSLTKMENLRIRRRQRRSMADATAACCWWCNQTMDDCLHKIIYEYICKCHRRRC